MITSVSIRSQLMDFLDSFVGDKQNEAQRLYSQWMAPPKESYQPTRPKFIFGRKKIGERKCLASYAERKKTKSRFKTVPIWERTCVDNSRYPAEKLRKIRRKQLRNSLKAEGLS